jgi:four helix bundle protein
VIKSFEDLDAFKRAYRLSLEIHRHSLDWPSEEQRGLGDQMRRSSKSICANIAEGFGKQALSAKEFNRFLFMAIGSCDEMRVWCRYCFDLGHIDEPTWQRWSDDYKEIAKMLQGLSRQVTGHGSDA